MSESSKPPVLWSVIIIRWAVGVLMAVVLVLALRPALISALRGKPKFTVSGDAADIGLVGVAPDGDEVLYDADGKLIVGATLDWQGERLYNWQPGLMQRDFLFEFGPGAEGMEVVENNAFRLTPGDARGWPMSLSIGTTGKPNRTPAGRDRVLIRVTVATNYYQNGLFVGGTRQRLLETADLQLYFYPAQRGAAAFTFKGPFGVGITNSPEKKYVAFVTVLPPGDGGRAFGTVKVWSTNMNSYNNAALFYDGAGRRHHLQAVSRISGGIGYTNLYELPAFGVTNLAYVTIGESSRTKNFQNVALRFPDRPERSYSPVLDRLAVALGRTNADVTRLVHESPRSYAEALTMLQFLPGHQNAMSYLAYAGSTTNFAQLSPAQREELRALARAWADHPDLNRRQLGLRTGLRGGWPKFTALAITRLREGSRADQSAAAGSLASLPTRLGLEYVPLLAGIARTNASPEIALNLVMLLGNLRGAAAQEALLELSRADDVWLWWQAIANLPLSRFAPIDAQPTEMQQRLWMVQDVKSGAVTAENENAARARLAAMLTPQICVMSATIFQAAAQRCAVRLDRDVALDAYAKYLRAAGNEHLRSYSPVALIQRINEWHGQNFGGLGDGKKSGGRYPSSDEYPGIVEDVLEFCDKLKRERERK